MIQNDHLNEPKESEGSTKPIFKALNSTKKVRVDDKRGPNHKHPISIPKKTDEEKRAFAAKQFAPKWAAHPLKEQILKWFEDGHSAYKVVDKILAKAVEDNVPQDVYSLSLPTLIKVRRRHLRTIGAMTQEQVQSRLKTVVQKTQTETEQILWATIKDCTERKKDSTISPKDWQYYDQQQQAAIALLQDLKAEGRTGEDIAIVISRVFAQFFKQFNKTPDGPQAVPGGTVDNVGQEEGKPV